MLYIVRWCWYSAQWAASGLHLQRSSYDRRSASSSQLLRGDRRMHAGPLAARSLVSTPLIRRYQAGHVPSAATRPCPLCGAVSTRRRDFSTAAISALWEARFGFDISEEVMHADRI